MNLNGLLMQAAKRKQLNTDMEGKSGSEHVPRSFFPLIFYSSSLTVESWLSFSAYNSYSVANQTASQKGDSRGPTQRGMKRWDRQRAQGGKKKTGDHDREHRKRQDDDREGETETE